MMKYFSILYLLALGIYFPLSAKAAEASLTWQSWSKDAFAQAKRENKLVLLDVEAVWCHWCHVMDEKTYGDPEIAAIIKKHFITIRVDQDANPEIATRYGDYGWPATILFNADGTEIIKRRGYIDKPHMEELLADIIKNPEPRTSSPAEAAPASSPYLTDKQRQNFARVYEEFYDTKYGGWGKPHRFIDGDIMEYTLRQASAKDGEAFVAKARKTLDSSLLLIDPEWGGVYQYSDELNWRSPHFEKIMQMQAWSMRSYADAYALWGEESYRKAAYDIRRYLKEFLTSPEGAFYTSQDADASAEIDGHAYFPLKDKERRKLGMPRIDTNIYANENGRAIDALLELYDATGDAEILAEADKAARWILANRATPEGGFRHGERDKEALFLNDTLFMGRALLHLYASSGDRSWLAEAKKAADFIIKNFSDNKHHGFLNALSGGDHFVLKNDPVKDIDENVLAVRFLNLLSHFTGDESYRQAAERGMKFLASPDFWKDRFFHSDIMLADFDIANPPLHITIVGGKKDETAQRLHKAALAFPAAYKRVEWWDRTEGPMPNPDVQYPELPQAAAFACTSHTCSLPIYETRQIAETVKLFTGMK